jgi:NTE family protein
MNSRTHHTPPHRPRIGLALGSGMARGWAHIGVIRALQRLGIGCDMVAGCSMGAVVGGLYLANKLDALEAWAISLNKLKVVRLLDLRMRSGGIIGGEKLVDELRQHLGGVLIEQLAAPYAAVTTDMVTGQEIWLQQGDLAHAMRASFSLPGIFPPLEHEGRWLLDGALVNPLPISACWAMGADVVIAVNINSDLPAVALPKHLPPLPEGFDVMQMLRDTPELRGKIGMMDTLARRVFQRERQVPSIFSVMTAAINIMQDRITQARLAADPPTIHLAPRLNHIGALDFDRAAEAMREGEAAVERQRDELLMYAR